MDNITQRSYAKVRFQLRDTLTVIHSDLKTSLMEPPVSLRTVQRWSKTLAEGTFKDQKGHRPVRLVDTTSSGNILRVTKLLKGVTLGSTEDVMSVVRQQLDRTSERELVRELEELRDHCNTTR